MKKIFLLFAVVSFFYSNAQKEEKIKINNRRFNISLEAGGIGSFFKLEGNSKLYNSYNVYGNNFDKPDLKDPWGFSIGSNYEYHLVKNSTFASVNLGLHYVVHGDPVFVSGGNASNNFKESETDIRGYLRMQSIRVPLYIHIRFFKLFGDEGVALETGANFDYLLSATLKPGKVDNSNFDTVDNPQTTGTVSFTDAFNKLSISPFAGFRFQFGPVYLNGRFSIIPAKKLFTDSYANYNSGNGHFEESFTSFGLGLLL
jgi:hypothetical protein